MLGVNTIKDLIKIDQIFQKRIKDKVIDGGVIIQQPDTVRMSFDTKIKKGSIIEPFVTIKSGVSIKEGSLNVLSKYFTGLKNEKKYKNPVKDVEINYLNPNKYIDKKRFSYTCSKVLLVNYKGKSNTKIKAIEQDVALEKLISQSWISDKIQNVKSFLSWVGNLKFYELTYSDNKKALEKVSEII